MVKSTDCFSREPRFDPSSQPSVNYACSAKTYMQANTHIYKVNNVKNKKKNGKISSGAGFQRNLQLLGREQETRVGVHC